MPHGQGKSKQLFQLSAQLDYHLSAPLHSVNSTASCVCCDLSVNSQLQCTWSIVPVHCADNCMCSTDKRSRQLQLASSAQLQTVNLIAQGQVSAVFWLGCNYSAQSHTVASAAFKSLICQPSCSSQWVNTKVHRTWCPSNGGREDIGFVVNMLAVHIWTTYRSEDH